MHALPGCRPTLTALLTGGVGSWRKTGKEVNNWGQIGSRGEW